jgi:hypothetical protein
MLQSTAVSLGCIEVERLPTVDLLDRIDAKLETKQLDPKDFERCAVDLLRDVYPGITPITGGTDFGHDADIGGLVEGPRLLATTGDPTRNLKQGLARMKKEGVSTEDGVVIATSRPVRATQRRNLAAMAEKAGSRLLQVRDRTWLSSALRRDGYWRRRLLELTSEPAALVARPIELRRYGEDLVLVGRRPVLEEVDAGSGDLVVVGPPGMGKTRLLAEAHRVAFVEHDPDHGRLAEDLDELEPAIVVVEDAARRPEDLRLIQRMGLEESHRRFRIAATAWPDEAEKVLEQLEGAARLDIQLLERPEMDDILRQLGITNHWFRSAILEQAEGRPGWAVILAKTAVQGTSRDVFDGQALARQVERYIRASGGDERRLHVLSCIALHGGVAEESLGQLGRRLGMRLHELTGVLHASTRNGLLERWDGSWRVRPEPLRVALIDRWFLGPESREPMRVLLEEHPEEEVQQVIAALQAALRGSCPGAEIGRERAPALTETVTEGEVGAMAILHLYAMLDEQAAGWAVRERIAPALADDGCPGTAKAVIRGILHDVVERFQTAEAVRILLDDALLAGGPTNLPRHPLRVLGDVAVVILPEIGTDPRRRERIFTAALDWLTAAPGPERWAVFMQLCRTVLGPRAAGTWEEPGRPGGFTYRHGVDSPQALSLIGDRLWPALEQWLPQAPDAAVAILADLAAAWLQVGYARLPWDPKPSRQQVEPARLIAARMGVALAARSASAPGLAIRFRHVFRRLAGFAVYVDLDFAVLARESVMPVTAHHRGQLRRLARRWRQEGPVAALGRLRSWKPQLELVGSGMTCEAYVLELVAEDLEEAGVWAAEAIRMQLEAGAPLVLAALQRTGDEDVPEWFPTGMVDAVMRPHVLAAALRPGVGAAVADEALRELDAADARCVLPAMWMRDRPDRVVSGLLVHHVPEVRATAAVAICPYDQHGLTLSAGDRSAWEAAIVSCQPEHLGRDLLHRFGRSLEFIARGKPDVATAWFRKRLESAIAGGFADGLPRECQGALAALPGASKCELLAMVPRHWRSLLFHEGLAGDDPSWVLEAMDAGTLDVTDAGHALDGLDGEGFEQLAAELVRRGLPPEDAAIAFELRVRSGDASRFYDELLGFCQELAGRSDRSLADIGEAGVARYSALRTEALEREHRERVLGF